MTIEQVLAKIRPHIRELKPYSSARDEYSGKEGIFLDANENAIGSVGKEAYNRYPDPYQKAIKNRLAQLKSVFPEEIFVGNGSDEAIDLLFRLFCHPNKDACITLPPTYGMYKVSASINQTEVIEVPLRPNYQPDLPTILKQASPASKLLFLCSPNNPTGNTMNPETVQQLLQQFPGVVVIDEAYIDFCPNKSWLPELKHYPNLVVLQTFSKAWGLAGLRVGLAFGHPQVIRLFNRIKPPYNVSEVAQAAVHQALQAPQEKDQMVAELLNNRQSLAEALSQSPQVLEIYPSEANFLLVKVRKPQELFSFLQEQQVIVRDRSKVTLCEGALRITVGTSQENEVLLNALKKFE